MPKQRSSRSAAGPSEQPVTRASTRASTRSRRQARARADPYPPPDPDPGFEPPPSSSTMDAASARRARLIDIHGAFEPNDQLPSEFRYRLDGNIDPTLDESANLRSHIYSNFASVVIDHAVDDPDLYRRLDAAVSVAHTNLEVVRRRIVRDFGRWQADSDSDALDAGLRAHIARVRAVAEEHRTDQAAASFAVALLLQMLDSVVRLHTREFPGCDVHGVRLEEVVDQLVGTPEDVVRLHLAALQGTIANLDAADAGFRSTPYRLARRLQHKIRFLVAG